MDTDENFLLNLRDALRAPGRRIQYDAPQERLKHLGGNVMVTSAFTRPLHIFVYLGQLFIGKKPWQKRGAWHMDLRSPDNDPLVVVEMFKEFASSQDRLLSRFRRYTSDGELK